MTNLSILGCPTCGQSPCACQDPNFLLHLFTPFHAFTPPPPNSITPSPLHSPTPRRPLRVLLMGERQDVLATIQNLHKRGFADAGDWSIPLPYPQRDAITQFIPRSPNVVISIHTKYFS